MMRYFKSSFARIDATATETVSLPPLTKANLQAVKAGRTLRSLAHICVDSSDGGAHNWSLGEALYSAGIIRFTQSQLFHPNSTGWYIFGFPDDDVIFVGLFRLSSQGTLSSYGHCVMVLHYLTRVGVFPSLLPVCPRRWDFGRVAFGRGRYARPRHDRETRGATTPCAPRPESKADNSLESG